MIRFILSIAAVAALTTTAHADECAQRCVCSQDAAEKQDIFLECLGTRADAPEGPRTSIERLSALTDAINAVEKAGASACAVQPASREVAQR